MKKLSKIEKHYIVLGVIFLCISATASALFQFAKGFITAAAIDKNLMRMLYCIAVLIAVTVMRCISHGLYYFFVQKFRTLRVKDLREQLFYSWVLADYEDFYKIPEGEKISYYQQQLPTLNMTYYFSFYGMGQITAETLICSAALFYVNPILALIGITFILLPAFVPQFFKKLLDKRQTQFLEIFHTHLGEFSNWQNGFAVIKNTGCGQWVKKLFGKSVDNVIHCEYRLAAANALSQVFSTFTSHLSVIAVLFYGVKMLNNNELSVSDFITAAALMNSLQGQVYYIASYISRFIMSKIIIKGYRSLLITCAKQKKERILPKSTTVIFDNVSFGYTKELVLTNVSKAFEEDGIHIICGESGSGKSTAMKLLLGLLTPSTGKITLGGYEVCRAKNTTDYISFLAQEPFFFDGTLKENLSLAKRCSNEEIFSLMRKLGLDQFAFEKVLETHFTHIESHFSGGELKRLSLVRTLLQNTPVIILDEPFANIDGNNVHSIEQVLYALTGKKIFIITHSLNNELKQHAVSIWNLKS